MLRGSLLSRGSVLVFLTCSLVAACGARDDENEHATQAQSHIVFDNGLMAIAGLGITNGLGVTNGLAITNGVITLDGLGSAAGLADGNGLLTTEAGRTTFAYLVRCALPATRSITRVDQDGTPHTFAGRVGIAPEWESGACDASCQERVSACMMAHVNTTGRSIQMWMVGESPALGWGYDRAYPFQEGAFFGNIFVSPPAAYYCNGRSIGRGVVPGRIGATQTGSPYQNPFADPGMCASACVPSASSHFEAKLTPLIASHGSDGYTSCATWNHVVTVYREFDAATDYKVCTVSSGLCLTVRGNSTDEGAFVDQFAYTNQPGQRFRITRVFPELTDSFAYTICVAGTQSCVTARTSGDVSMSLASNAFGRQWTAYAPPTNGGSHVLTSYAHTVSGLTKRLAPLAGSTAPGTRIGTALGGTAWTILPAD
jgi:hypothetical protein